MRSSTIVALTAATLGAALPTTPANTLSKRQYTGSQACYDNDSYTIDEQNQHPGDWTAVSGDLCKSSNVDSCTVGKSNSVTLGVSITTGGGLDLGEIFSVDTSVTWSYSETKTETVTQTCPKGGYVCGLMYQATLVDVKGKKITTTSGTCALDGDQRSEDYAFTAPLLVSDKPEVQYAACISDTSPNKDTANLGIDMCPEGL